MITLGCILLIIWFCSLLFRGFFALFGLYLDFLSVICKGFFILAAIILIAAVFA